MNQHTIRFATVLFLLLTLLVVVAGCYLEVPIPRDNPLDPLFSGAKSTCTADADCGSGRLCNNGRCFTPECKADADCGIDKQCKTGFCVANLCTTSTFVGAAKNLGFDNQSNRDVHDVVFHPTATALVSGSGDGSIKFWKIQKKKPVIALDQVLTGHTGPVFSLALNRDGSMLASGGADGTVRIWDTVGRKLVATLEGHTAEVTDVDFPTPNTIVSGSNDKTIRFWDVTKKAASTLKTLTVDSPVLSVKLSPRGAFLAAGLRSGDVAIWSGGDFKRKIPDASKGEGFLELNSPIYGLDWKYDGSAFITAPDSGNSRVWSPHTMKLLKEMLVSSPGNHPGHPWGVSWSPNGVHAATSGSAGRVIIWNTDTGALVASLKNMEFGDMSNLTYHPNGKLLAGAGATINSVPAIGLWKCP